MRYKGLRTMPQKIRTNMRSSASSARFRIVPIYYIPAASNVISSHTVYKVQIADERFLRLKALITPYCNEDSRKHAHRSDCSICSPVGIRIIVSMAEFRKWRLSKPVLLVCFPPDRQGGGKSLRFATA